VRVAIRTEILGILFIALLGSLLHFAYDGLGRTWWVGIFAAVDESVWEHLKLAFWPAVAWIILTGPYLAPQITNFWLAKAISTTLMPLIIAVGFYAYTALLGHHALLWDMLLFIGAIAIGQIVALIIYRLPYAGSASAHFAKILLIAEAAAFGTLTFLPLNLPIFVEAG
jgi:hypothetical protein